MMAFTGVPLLVLTPSTGNDYNIHTAVGFVPALYR